VTSTLLIALALSTSQGGPTARAVATATILPATTISFDRNGFEKHRRNRFPGQLSRLGRIDRANGQSELLLIEFQ
jgi:hypothetical protein